jgi:hypothetical protein
MPKTIFNIIGLIILLSSTYLSAAQKNASYFSMQKLEADDFKSSDLIFRAGKYIDGNDLSSEIRIGIPLQSGSKTNSTQETTYKTNLLLGAYLTKSINIDSRGASSFYGLLGFTFLNYNYDVKENNSTSTTTELESSASWGVGTNFHLTDHSYFNLEYVEYNKSLSKTENPYKGLSIGFTIDI